MYSWCLLVKMLNRLGENLMWFEYFNNKFIRKCDWK